MNPNPQRPTIPGPVQRKVFDVMRPGRAPANSTSKPVIVGHKPMVQDRSVTVNGVGARPLLDTHKKISITSHDDAPATVPMTPAASAAQAPPLPKTPVATSLPTAPAPDPKSSVPVAPEPTASEPASESDTSPTVWPPHDEQPTVPDVSTVTSSIPDETEAKQVVSPPDESEPVGPDDELLAAMPAPEVDGHHAPAAQPGHVGPHTIPLRWLVPIIITAVLALVIVDLLLDADFLSWSIPHTHFLR